MPSRRALGRLCLPAALLLIPGAVERMGAPFEDDALRAPLLFLATALALRGTPSPWARTVRAPLLAALGLGLPVLLHPTLSPAGAPLFFLLVAGAVLVGARESRDATLEDGLGLAGVLVAAWTLIDALLGRPAVGPLGRAGVTGPTLAALLPFSVAFGLRRLRDRPVVVRVLPALGVVAALVVTRSRTALVAGGFAALLAFALAAPAPARRRRLAAAGGFAALATIGLALGVTGAVPGLAGRTDTVDVRVGLAKASAALVAERPLVGHGPHGFAAEVLRVRDPEEARISDGRRPLAAHDDVLHFAVEGGVLSGLAALALLVLAVRGGVRSGSWAPAGAALAIAVSALAEDPLLASPTAWLAGWLAGLPAAGTRPEEVAAPRRGTRLCAGVVAAVGVVVLVALAWGIADPLPQTVRDEGTRARAYREAVARFRSPGGNGEFAAYRELLRQDPGMTEARIDLAEIARLRGDREEARAILEEARRRDPTRFDVPLRLGHLSMGEEPAPSQPQAPQDPVLALRLYDEAITLAPRRFEGPVALSRVHRRMGRLKDASRELMRAKTLGGLPAETVVESFRIAEAEGSPAAASKAILALACAQSPAAAGDVLREAERFLDVADAAEAEALVKARETLRPDLGPARTDREAASLRLAALLEAKALEPTDLANRAREDAKAGRRGRAVARWRALLADPARANDADLVFEAARAASGFEPGLAAQWQSRGRTLLGYEAAAKEDWASAVRDFRAAADKDAANAAARYGLSRALAHAGSLADAAVALKEAIALDASLRSVADAQPDLKPVLPLLPK